MNLQNHKQLYAILYLSKLVIFLRPRPWLSVRVRAWIMEQRGSERGRTWWKPGCELYRRHASTIIYTTHLTLARSEDVLNYRWVSRSLKYVSEYGGLWHYSLHCPIVGAFLVRKHNPHLEHDASLPVYHRMLDNCLMIKILYAGEFTTLPIVQVYTHSWAQM